MEREGALEKELQKVHMQRQRERGKLVGARRVGGVSGNEEGVTSQRRQVIEVENAEVGQNGARPC